MPTYHILCVCRVFLGKYYQPLDVWYRYKPIASGDWLVKWLLWTTWPTLVNCHLKLLWGFKIGAAAAAPVSHAMHVHGRRHENPMKSLLIIDHRFNKNLCFSFSWIFHIPWNYFVAFICYIIPWNKFSQPLYYFMGIKPTENLISIDS